MTALNFMKRNVTGTKAAITGATRAMKADAKACNEFDCKKLRKLAQERVKDVREQETESK
ncbi:MAG: hypothetical protein Q9184_003334 [Pyrenodesmia sp. 2 TL-2023]